jgi:cysteine/O-acetylserine efflux protein
MPPNFPWVPLLSYTLIVGMTPGPNNIISMNNAKIVGFRLHVPVSLGVITSYFFVMSVTLFFSSVVMRIMPAIQLPLRIAGALYMGYLIFKLLRPSAKQKPLKEGSGYPLGLVLGLLNPKFTIFGLTAASSFITPHVEGPVLFIFAVLIAFICGGSTLVWAAAGTVFSAAFAKHGRIINIVMSALLIYCIVALFI